MTIITDATRSEEHFDQGGKQIKKQEALKMGRTKSKHRHHPRPRTSPTV